MSNEEFEKRLKKINLTKKEFAKQVNMSYGGVVNWGRSSQNIPSWVDSWLQLYECCMKYTQMKETLKESGICSQSV